MVSELRLNTEKKIDNKYFNLMIGTTNRLNPKAIYVEGRTFIKPLEDYEDYEYEANLIKHKLKKSLINELKTNELFDKNFIIDIDLPTVHMKHMKKTFMSFQITLKQKNDPPYELKRLQQESSDMFNKIVDQLSDEILANEFQIEKCKS